MVEFFAKWGTDLLIAFLTLTIGSGALFWHRRASLDRGRFQRLMILIAICVITGAAGLWIVHSRLAPVTRSLGTLRAGIGQGAPNVFFRNLADDAPHRLAEFKGKTVLLNIWATYCPPCLSEMPQLDRLESAYRERNLVVILLSDEPPDKQRVFFQRHPTRLLCGYANSMHWIDVGKFRPWTLVIDNEGLLRNYSFGAPGFGQLEAMIGPYLRKGRPNQALQPTARRSMLAESVTTDHRAQTCLGSDSGRLSCSR
jgi:cytochrome c biogenesis protein CcmG/thiol:disulfide interchange protein DsbE